MMKATPSSAATYTSQLRTRINEYLRDALKTSGHGDLVPSYGAVLHVVLQHGGKVQIKGIYDDLCKQKTTITESINRLVKLGYLTKLTCPTDARCTYVQATDKLYDFEDDFKRISDELNAQLFRGFSADEQQDFVDLMLRAIDNFSDRD
jgi:DNA-binding MarR family transcriptional regulator